VEQLKHSFVAPKSKQDDAGIEPASYTRDKLKDGHLEQRTFPIQPFTTIFAESRYRYELLKVICPALSAAIWATEGVFYGPPFVDHCV